MSSPKGEDQGFELDRVWLRFRDPAVEAVFVSDMLRSSINFIRAYLIAGTCLYISFGFLDYVVGGASLNALWLIRYGIVVPILLGILSLTFFQLFDRVAQQARSVVMISCGLGIVAMTAFMGPPFNSQ